MHLVLISALTLLNQVVVELGYLDNLLALPTCNKHRTLFPIVKINRLWVERFIVTTTEVTNLVFLRCLLLQNWLGLGRWFLLFLGRLLFLLLSLFKALGSLRVDIRSNIYHRFLFFNFALWLINVCFLKSGIYLIDLCLSQIRKTRSYLVTHDFVQLNNTLSTNLTHILQSMLNSNYRKL